MTLDEVIQQVNAYGCKLVEITGGEPLIQKEVYPLTERLCDLGHTVLIETSGSLPIWELDERVIRIMDLKPPGSGHEHSNLWENIAHLRPVDEVKFVVLDRRDFDWACEIIRKYDLTRRAKVLFSPVHESLTPQQLAEWLLESRLTARLQIQLHKYLWGPNVRGV
jgi:7-carboxy-7-deazaguanine synthase